MAFPENIFVPIGVVSAALIAGAIAYAGFISTKESKVSEFRQNWINSLRDEISKYISCIDSLIEHITKDNAGMMYAPTKFMEKKLDHSELYTEMLQARISIHLRINNKEKKPEDFERNEKFLTLIENIYIKFESRKFADVYEDIKLLTSASRDLLKHEWNRARDGEKKFQEAKAVSEWTMGAAGAFLMALFMTIGYEALTTALASSSASPETKAVTTLKAP
ncbi:hypothetical protein [Pseudomonas sp. GW456-L14]|uniref:hypothetical protein n=1 Tax=Pseudomonas sp. GW456-L14 TaxID=2070632 RepID=UPI0011AF6CC3|nr:hypothetical protein [Pseudomonas sp. GW456-L14]